MGDRLLEKTRNHNQIEIDPVRADAFYPYRSYEAANIIWQLCFILIYCLVKLSLPL